MLLSTRLRENLVVHIQSSFCSCYRVANRLEVHSRIYKTRNSTRVYVEFKYGTGIFVFVSHIFVICDLFLFHIYLFIVSHIFVICSHIFVMCSHIFVICICSCFTYRYICSCFTCIVLFPFIEL